MFACETPTAKYPNGRTGTRAGYEADRKSPNGVCDACQRAQVEATAAKKVPSGKDKIASVLDLLNELAEDTNKKVGKRKPKRRWQSRAACSGKTNLFFSVESEDLRQAAALCSGCPVRLDCAADSQDEVWGMWGGVSSFTKFACAMPTPQYPDGRTGTMAGVMAHSRAGEPICEQCLIAQRDERSLA